jgi:hypothetical protein
MASQKLTNCCVAAIALVTAAYLSTPHSSTIARLAFGAFCLAIHSLAFLQSIKFDLIPATHPWVKPTWNFSVALLPWPVLSFQ